MVNNTLENLSITISTHFDYSGNNVYLKEFSGNNFTGTLFIDRSPIAIFNKNVMPNLTSMSIRDSNLTSFS
jgi:hypothetical protein